MAKREDRLAESRVDFGEEESEWKERGGEDVVLSLLQAARCSPISELGDVVSVYVGCPWMVMGRVAVRVARFGGAGSGCEPLGAKAR